MDVGCKQCCRVGWLAVERFHGLDLVNNVGCVTDLLICMLLRSIGDFYVCLSVVLQVFRRKEGVHSCSVPSKGLCVCGPPICHRTHASVFSFKV